ncbi:MAG: flagellar basal body P-ring protein FlgI [Planctomycetaceae bacterium]|nr:flagellar basal body P-ring protein FlgI [Planctomycetaceae bacterium]
MLKQFRFVLLAGAVLSAVFLATGGCNQFFGKKDKDPPFDPYEMPDFETVDGRPKLIGDCAFVGGLDVIPVQGYGLVVELPGTGGEDFGSIAYQMVYDDMNRMGVSGIRALLARPDTAVVEVIGYVRPGVQSGDRLDVQVSLPENSQTRSLHGGRLMHPTRLIERIFVDGGVHTGDPRAIASGSIMVDDMMATETNNPGGLKKGTILNGAEVRKTRELSLVLPEEEKSLIMTDRIAKAVNNRFLLPTGVQRGVANAQNDVQILLKVHPSYANDIPRYVRVIQSIAVNESPARQARRIERLAEELLEPTTSQHAAFQLEGIGRAGIPPLQRALRSSDMEVRFHAATSLAYLGDGTSAKILAEIVRAEPAFRVFALNALSVMKNDLDAEFHLQELLHVPDGEIRYGAFRALKSRNPTDRTIRGEIMGDPTKGQFSYHGINTQAPPMVHITAQRTPEIVLFGTNIFLRQPFGLNAGPLYFVNGHHPNEVVVSRFVTRGTDEKRTVSNRLDEIIRAVVDMGGTYPDVVQLIRRADRAGVLSCRLEVDCLPEADRTYRRSGGELDFLVEKEEEKPRTFWERINPRNLFAPNPGEKTSDFRGPVNTSPRD